MIYIVQGRLIFMYNERVFKERRKTDKYNPSVIILSILSLIGMIIYIYTF
jgi:hypothetical protein